MEPKQEKKEDTEKFLSTKQIYDILCQIAQLEEELKNKSNSKKQEAYLIDKKSFDSLKEFINYKNLKTYTNKRIYDFKRSEKLIKSTIKEEDIKKIKELNNSIIYYSFNNSRDLIKELHNNQAKYYLINKIFANKIFILKENNKANQIFHYDIKDKIIVLRFGGNDFLNFKNNKGIIEESNLIKDNNKLNENLNENNPQKLVNDKEINKEMENQNNLNLKEIEEIKKNYKYQLQITLGIFFNYIEIEKKENITFKELTKEKTNRIFLINNIWMENFKIFYEYKDIESHLLNHKDIIELESENIIDNLPIEYFNKMIPKFKSNQNKLNEIEEIFQVECKIKLKKYNIDLKYFHNFQIINSKVSGLLTIAGYNYNQIKADLYYIGDNKILLRFNKNISLNNSICDEIGIINETKIFIPQYILYYSRKIEDSFLNKFLSENIKTISEQSNLPLKIFDNNNDILGYCFSIKYISLIKSQGDENIKENQNLIEKNNNNDENELNNDIQNIEKISVNINDKLKSKIYSNENKNINLFNQILKNKRRNDLDKVIKKENSSANNNEDIINQNQTNEKDAKNNREEIKEDNNEEINKPIESIIEIVLLINKFENEIDKKLIISSNSNKSKIEECLLLKEEWINNFKKIYINEEIEKYLTDLVSKDDNSVKKILFSSLKNKKDYIDKINKANFSISLNDIIYFNTNNLAKLIKNNDIFYLKDFYIINLDIFEKLLDFYQIDKNDELNKCKNNMVKYMINNEKIIFSYEYISNNDDNDIIYYNILICEKNKKIIKPIIIQCFEDKKKERDEIFEQYITNQFFLGKDVGDIDDGIIVKRPIKEKEFEENIYKLFQLYNHIQKLRKKLNEEIKLNLKNAEEREYYIVNKKWINDFSEFFEFNKLSSLYKENKDKKPNELFFSAKNDETIKNKIKQKDNFLNTKYCLIDEKIFENVSINYYNNFELVDDEIKDLIEQLINIKFEIKGKFLFGNNRIFAYFNNQNYLLIGTFNKDKAFITNFLIQFNNHKFIDLYINEFKSKAFEDVIKQFKGLNENSYDKLRGNFGNIYNIKNDIEQSIINANELKDKIQENFIKKLNESKSKKSKKENEIADKFQIQGEDEKKESNKNSIQNEGEEEIDEVDKILMKNIIFKEEECKENANEENEKLNAFDERQIKALIKYYFFIHWFKKNIDISDKKDKKFVTFDCYLINYDWIKEYKNFYLYDELIKIIQQKDINFNSDKNKREKFIFENLTQDYINKIIMKKDSYDENIFENTNKIAFHYNKTEINKQNIKYPIKFEIISSEVYNLIKIRKNKTLDLLMKSCILNTNKIIIKYESKDLFEILIGNYDFDTNKFLIEILLKYDSENAFKTHYNSLQYKGLEIFLKDKVTNLQINENSQKVGQIFQLYSEKKKEFFDEIKNQNQLEQIKMMNKLINYKNIKFLFNLHYFLNILKFAINNNNSKSNQPKKCYLIKKEIIDIYSNFYEVDSTLKKNEEKINKLISYNNTDDLQRFFENLIEIHQKKINNKDINDIKYKLEKSQYLFDVSFTQYENENFLCLEDYIISNEKFDEIKNITNFQYIIIENKIILLFNQNMNIGIIDKNNNTFIPETIIKFEEKYLNDIIQRMNFNGISQFESDFKSIYSNTNNLIYSLKTKNENIKKNNEPKFNNFFNNNPLKNINKADKESEIKKQIKLLQIQKSLKKRIHSLKLILSLMIDIEKIKRKMTQSLKGSKKEKYYLLNNKFFNQYISLKNMKEIIKHLIENKIIESYMGNENEELENSYIISEIKQNLDKNMIDKIFSVNEHLSKLLDDENIKVDRSYIKKEKDKYLVYYYDFILISQETEELFLSEFPSNQQIHLDLYNIYLGENKIFLKLPEQNIIELCHLDNKNAFQPSMLFEFNNTSDLNKNINLLTSYEFIDYTKYFLMFNDDYISPIFDQNNVRIGRAYRYNEELKDYSKFISQEKKIKTMIKLYFSNIILKTKFNKKNQEEHFFIINENYLKNFGMYSTIEASLNQLDLSIELNEILNSESGEHKLEQLIDGKKLSLKIKNLMPENKNNFSNQNEIIESDDAPNLVPYSCNGQDFFYFDNFRLIEVSLEEQLSENKINLIKSITNNNIVKCFIIEKYILIDVSNNNNRDNFHKIYQVSEINQQNKINPRYILAYKKSDYFKYHINFIFNNLNFSFQNFLEGFSFSQGNRIELSIDSGSGELQVGFIYKLSLESKVQNQNQILPNNISINNSNINIINNSSPNININISCNPSFITSNIGNNNFNNFNQNQNQQNNNFNQCISPLDFSIDKEYITHPLVGLKNVGATCYMNATLQCFLNLKRFINYFKYKVNYDLIKNFRSKRNNNLTESFKYLIENVWQTPGNNYIVPKYNSKNANNKYFIPTKFKEKISIMNPLFAGAQANDAKDLVNFLIMTLHEELNRAEKKNNINTSNLLINQSDLNSVYKNFVINFANENMSLISDLFYAMNDNVTECSICHDKKYNFQIYFFLNFPLEEVRKFKIQRQVEQFNQSNQNLLMMNQNLFQQNLSMFQNNLNNTINSVNLDDCFIYNQKIEEFSGQNAMYCNTCRMTTNNYYHTLLTTGPEILIIVLNRGKGKEFDVKCDFVQQLNLYEYIEMKDTGFMYDLVGVVTHMGYSDNTGHFIAYCRSPIEKNNWYRYNDDLVTPVYNFVKEVINYAMPYILFYQKCQ